MTNGIPLLQNNAGHAILASRLVVNVDKKRCIGKDIYPAKTVNNQSEIFSF
jgi:hypothetical protein